jgi:hypothetical protein
MNWMANSERYKKYQNVPDKGSVKLNLSNIRLNTQCDFEVCFLDKNCIEFNKEFNEKLL